MLYSIEALEKGMHMINKRLEEVCEREGVKFIWNNVPSNANNFIDDSHYTIAG